jgi:predicted nicotinamide N-methyase
MHGAEEFIRANTSLTRLPYLPEISLYLADEVHGLWRKTEAELAEIGLPPPFWAFAWPGGQAVARYILNKPETVRGLSVLDFATGSGMVAIAAAMAGAKSVTAIDIEPFCEAAVTLNAAANHVAIDFLRGDPIGSDGGWDVVLAGDIFYEAALVERVAPWFKTLAARGALVLAGDPERYYMPRKDVEPVVLYKVPVNPEVEDDDVKHTTVWRFV